MMKHNELQKQETKSVESYVATGYSFPRVSRLRCGEWRHRQSPMAFLNWQDGAERLRDQGILHRRENTQKENYRDLQRSPFCSYQYVYVKKLHENGHRAIQKLRGNNTMQANRARNSAFFTIQPGKYAIHRILEHVLRRILCQLWRKINLKVNAVLVHKTKVKINMQRNHSIYVTQRRPRRNCQEYLRNTELSDTK